MDLGLGGADAIGMDPAMYGVDEEEALEDEHMRELLQQSGACAHACCWHSSVVHAFLTALRCTVPARCAEVDEEAKLDRDAIHQLRVAWIRERCALAAACETALIELLWPQRVRIFCRISASSSMTSSSRWTHMSARSQIICDRSAHSLRVCSLQEAIIRQNKEEKTNDFMSNLYQACVICAVCESCVGTRNRRWSSIG